MKSQESNIIQGMKPALRLELQEKKQSKGIVELVEPTSRFIKMHQQQAWKSVPKSVGTAAHRTVVLSGALEDFNVTFWELRWFPNCIGISTLNFQPIGSFPSQQNPQQGTRIIRLYSPANPGTLCKPKPTISRNHESSEFLPKKPATPVPNLYFLRREWTDRTHTW